MRKTIYVIVALALLGAISWETWRSLGWRVVEQGELSNSDSHSILPQSLKVLPHLGDGNYAVIYTNRGRRYFIRSHIDIGGFKELCSPASTFIVGGDETKKLQNNVVERLRLEKDKFAFICESEWFIGHAKIDGAPSLLLTCYFCPTSGLLFIEAVPDLPTQR